MEIFQTIWTALITPNETLINLFSIPLTFVEIFVSMLLFTTIFNISTDKKYKYSYVLSASTLSVILGLTIPNPYRSILSLITIPILIHMFFKTNWIKSILSSFIPIILVIIFESIYMWVISNVFSLDLYELTSITIFRITFAILTYFFMYLLYRIIKSFHIVLYIIDNINFKTKMVLFANIIIGIITIIVQFYLYGFFLKYLPLSMVVLSLISFIAYFGISLYTITRITKLELTKKDLEQEKENNRILKEMQDELRGFRHDFSNIMCTIGGYVQVKDIEGLTKYYSQIQKDINKVNNLGSLNSDTINNPAVFVLISSKYSKALELGIDMNINVFLDLNKLNMKIYEFTRVLGILLDNALEAAKDCDEKLINIEIRKESNRNRQVLIIENTYNNKDIDTEKIFEKNFSTKSGNSGLGLWEVRQILKKNNNLNLFTSKNDKLFKQQLEMYN